MSEELQFAVVDPQIVLAQLIREYEGLTRRTLAPGDPIRLLLQAISAVILQERAFIDDAGKQNLVSYSRDEYLDSLGEFVDVHRTPPARASATVEFTLSGPRPAVVLIPQGTQVSAGQVVFETTSAVTIDPGSLTGRTRVVAVEGGLDGNGYAAGQIKSLVHPIPFVKGVANLDETSGGSDEEKDPSLAQRIKLKPRSFSVAGPHGAYEYWTRTANPSITDVAILGPPATNPGEVHIHVLVDDGQLPSGGVLDEIKDALEDVRPLTDHVLVGPPSTHEKSLSVQYFVAESSSDRLAEIADDVENAVDEYVAWQTGTIGRDFVPDKLRQLVMSAGAKRLIVTGVIDSNVPPNAVARITSVSIDGPYVEED